jgi:hypothetical protein
MRRGEIAVASAAGCGVHQIETEFGRERPGVLVQGRAGIALFVRRPVQFAGDPDAHAVGFRFHPEDLCDHLVGGCNRRHPQVDLGIGLLGNDIRPGPAPDDADIDRYAAFGVVHRLERLNDIAEFADGAAAVLGPRAGMRRHALDEHLEAGDALAPGDDLAAVARRLGHQHIFCPAALGFDQRPRRRAADFLIGDIELGYAKRRSCAIRANLAKRMIGEVSSALHVIDAGPECAVAIDLERQPRDESHRMHGVEMAQHQDSRRVLPP